MNKCSEWRQLKELTNTLSDMNEWMNEWNINEQATGLNARVQCVNKLAKGLIE